MPSPAGTWSALSPLSQSHLLCVRCLLTVSTFAGVLSSCIVRSALLQACVFPRLACRVNEACGVNEHITRGRILSQVTKVTSQVTKVTWHPSRPLSPKKKFLKFRTLQVAIQRVANARDEMGHLHASHVLGLAGGRLPQLWLRSRRWHAPAGPASARLQVCELNRQPHSHGWKHGGCCWFCALR